MLQANSRDHARLYCLRERLPGRARDHRVEEGEAVSVVGITRTGRPFGRVAEQMTNADDAGALQVDSIAGNRVIERDESFLDELHDDDRSKRLRKGGEMVDC